MRWLHRAKRPPVGWHWSVWVDDDEGGYGYVDQTCQICGRRRTWWYM